MLLESISTAKTTLEVAEMVKVAKEQGWLKKLLSLARTKRKILVLGSSGVGKTQFISSLAKPEQVPISAAYGRTQHAVKGSPIDIEGLLFSMVDTPGQIGHEQRRQAAIRTALAKNYFGIINVVAYGYHEGNVKKAEALTLKGQPRTQFLSENRDAEIELLEELRARMVGDEQLWLLTVVTKGDLWWDQRQTVLDHYGKVSQGNYAQALKKLLPHLKTTVVEYCSLTHKFFGSGPISGNFDDQAKRLVRQEFFEVFGTLIRDSK